MEILKKTYTGSSNRRISVRADEDKLNIWNKQTILALFLHELHSSQKTDFSTYNSIENRNIRILK